MLYEGKVLDVTIGQGNNVQVIHSPNHDQFNNMIDKHKIVRGSNHSEHGLFVWSGHDATHKEVHEALKKQHGFEINPRSSHENRDFIMRHESGKPQISVYDGLGSVVNHPILRKHGEKHGGWDVKDYEEFDNEKNEPKNSPYIIAQKAKKGGQKLFEEVLSEGKVLPAEHDYFGKHINYNIVHNPNHEQLKNMVDKHKLVRGLYHKDNGLFVWNGHDSIHNHAKEDLTNQHGFFGNGEETKDFIIKKYDYMGSEKTAFAGLYDHHATDVLQHPTMKNYRKNEKLNVVKYSKLDNPTNFPRRYTEETEMKSKKKEKNKSSPIDTNPKLVHQSSEDEIPESTYTKIKRILKESLNTAMLPRSIDKKTYKWFSHLERHKGHQDRDYHSARTDKLERLGLVKKDTIGKKRVVSLNPDMVEKKSNLERSQEKDKKRPEWNWNLDDVMKSLKQSY